MSSIIDKATYDSLMTCDEDGAQAGTMMAEVARVLEPGGHYLCISHSEPEEREELLQLCGRGARPGGPADQEGLMLGADHDDGGSRMRGADEGTPSPLFDVVQIQEIQNGKATYYLYVLRRRGTPI